MTFAAGPRLGWLMQRKMHGQSAVLLAAQTVMGIYGGYFGGAVSIMMMAVWSLFGITDIRAMNGIEDPAGGSDECCRSMVCSGRPGLVAPSSHHAIGGGHWRLKRRKPTQVARRVFTFQEPVIRDLN